MSLQTCPIRRGSTGHTMIELVAAMVAGSVLLAGLASVMMIGRQVAFTPSAPAHRLDAARVLNDIAADLRFATCIIEQSPVVLDFVVPDRNADGVAERFRYQWSGTPGDPLTRAVNGAAAATVLDSVQEFQVTPTLHAVTETFTTTVTSAETLLASNTNVQGAIVRNVNPTDLTAQQINPQAFPAIPAGAVSWNATRADVYARSTGALTGTLSMQLRPAGDPNAGPTSHILGAANIPESALSNSFGWNSASFSSPVSGLFLHRKYSLAFVGLFGGTNDAQLSLFDGPATGMAWSSDAGASWTMPSIQVFYRLYGTYTSPGASHTFTRQIVRHVRVVLRSGGQNHSRIDARVPLLNEPELLSKYWRADFDRDPTAADANGDGALDWALAGNSQFDSATLSDGIWRASGSLETRPLDDFTQNTTVEVRCKNVTQGGNGAVVRINADRQGGTHAPLFFHLQLQTDNTQTLSLFGKSSDAVNVRLFTRQKLPNDFIRVRLTILPAGDVVNLQINEVDQGTFTYPTCPPSLNDRYLTMFADTSAAHFDYAEVRVAAP